MNILTKFWVFIKGYFQTKVNDNKQPLSRENAYTLSSIGKKHGNYSDITKKYHEYIMKQIESSARFGANYLLIQHPGYVTPTDKETVVEYITKLGYSICFHNEDVLLISWKYSVTDFDQ